MICSAYHLCHSCSNWKLLFWILLCNIRIKIYDPLLSFYTNICITAWNTKCQKYKKIKILMPFFCKLEVKLILWRKRCVQLEDGFGSQGNESFLRKAGCDYHISKHFTYIIGDNHISILLEYFLYQIAKCVWFYF